MSNYFLVVLTPEQMKCTIYYWHDDEVKIIKSDFMLGKWYSAWTKIPLAFGLSF